MQLSASLSLYATTYLRRFQNTQNKAEVSASGTSRGAPLGPTGLDVLDDALRLCVCVRACVCVCARARVCLSLPLFLPTCGLWYTYVGVFISMMVWVLLCAVVTASTWMNERGIRCTAR